MTEALGGLPPHKVHCSVLAEEAVRAAVKDYYDRQGLLMILNGFRIVFPVKPRQIHPCEPDGIGIAGERSVPFCLPSCI